MNHEASSPAPAGWVSEKELARHLNISPRHLHNLRRAGLPYIALGKTIRFDRAEVEAYLRSNRRLSSHIERQRRRKSMEGAQ
jgi:excisionase family DNA binding protein